MFALLFGVLGVASTEAALTCTDDVDGANDEPNQKDLTRFCKGLASDFTSCAAGSFDFGINWNWDDTALSGTNTGDACALFDTDGDSNTNFALCVTIGGSPAAQLTAVSPRLYSCGNTRPDRCTSPILQITTFDSTCTVDQDSTPPFSPSASCKGTNCATEDTRATCCIDLADFVATEAILLDTCSYPSQQPNSDPSDCIVTQECHTDTDCTGATECTTATCTDGICRYPVEAGRLCDDGDACTLDDQCNAEGVCEGLQLICPTPGQCQLAGTCDSTTGECFNPNVPDGTSCDDENACTAPDTCQAGVCTGGTSGAVQCTASDQCHNAGVCDPATGTCSNPAKSDGASCIDGNACTQTDTCQGGSCVGSNPVVCPTPDQCHNLGTCDSTTGTCSNPNKTNGTLCNADHNACTSPDTCQSGICQPGGPVTVPD